MRHVDDGSDAPVSTLPGHGAAGKHMPEANATNPSAATRARAAIAGFLCRFPVRLFRTAPTPAGSARPSRVAAIATKRI
jgi:hypothetical protein